MKALVLSGMMLASGFSAHAQATAPSPSEKELQAPLVLDDGKPTPGARSEAGPSGWRAFGSMLVVLGLAGGGLWAFRRWGAKRLPGSGGSRLNVEETLALGDRRFVSILRADDETFLIALGPQGATLLARLNSVEAAGPTDFAQAPGMCIDPTTTSSVKLPWPNSLSSKA